MNEDVEYSHNICKTLLKFNHLNNDNSFGYLLILPVTDIFSHRLQREQIANIAFKKHSSEGKRNNSKRST